MTSLRSLMGLTTAAIIAAGCYAQTASAQQSFPEPVEVTGPPGGGMDPQDPYAPQPPQGTYTEDPQNPQSPQQQAVGPDGQPIDPNYDQSQMDPQDAAAAMGDVTDQEIDQTLDGQGTWEDVDGYGRVWRPDATEVGADFTPYETDGTWVDTDSGWAFDTGYSWGWLPYHYGRWGWFGGYWGWQPGHSWGSSWVDWRHGGGYVGWRPSSPIAIRGGVRPLAQHDANWRFASEGQLGAHNIRSHLFNNPAEGLRVTQPVRSLGIHGATTVRASALMRNRVAARAAMSSRGAVGVNRGGVTNRGAVGQQRGIAQQPRDNRGEPTWQRQQPASTSRGQSSYRAPAYRQQPERSAPSTRMPSSSYHAPSHTSSSSHGSSSSYHSSGGGGGHSFGGGGHSGGGGGGHRR